MVSCESVTGKDWLVLLKPNVKQSGRGHALASPVLQDLANPLLAILTFSTLVLLLTPPARAQPSVPEYIGSQACAACHSEEAAAWQGSHHDLAWTLPDPEDLT